MKPTGKFPVRQSPILPTQHKVRNSPHVLCLGELLADLVPEPAGAPLGRANSLRIAAGGAPANVAVAVKRLGIPSAFIGKVGDDPFGRLLRKVLASEAIDLQYLQTTQASLTRLACVTNDANEQQRFVFYGHPGADVLLSEADIDARYIKQGRFFHFGSISLIREPARSATVKAVKLARQHGLIVSFDPNLRPALWPASRQAHTQIMRALQWCHILKLSDSEWKFLFPGQRLKEFFSLPEAKGIRLLAVTMGKAGSYLATPSSTVRVKAMKVKVADPTGAGDGFMAGILYGLAKIDGGLNGGTAALRKIATFANAVGSLTCTKAGGIPAFPSLREVKANLVRA